MDRAGVIIVDASRRISVITPAAEELLGWGSEVGGQACSSVLDCHDPEGGSLCGQCGIGASFKRQELIPAEIVDVALAAGGRRRVRMSFWYLPPEGHIYEPRVMAILHD